MSYLIGTVCILIFYIEFNLFHFKKTLTKHFDMKNENISFLKNLK